MTYYPLTVGWFRPTVAYLRVGYLPMEFTHRNHLLRANRLAVRRAMPRGLYHRTPWGRR